MATLIVSDQPMAFWSFSKFVGRRSAMTAPQSPPPLPPRRGPSDADLDLAALGAVLWRKKWKILVPTILVGLITLFVVQSIAPKYQAESRVFIEERDNVYLRPDVDRDTDRGTVDQEAVTSQAQI